MTDNIEYFRCDVKRFDTIDTEILKIQDKLKPLNDKLKELKKKKKDLQDTICEYMETNEIGECKLQDGALLFKESKSVVPITKGKVYENITFFFKKSPEELDSFNKLSAEAKTEKLYNFIYEENRTYTEKKSLKRI